MVSISIYLKLRITRLETNARSPDLKKYLIKIVKYLIMGSTNLKFEISESWILRYMLGMTSYIRFIEVEPKVYWIVCKIFCHFYQIFFKSRKLALVSGLLVIVFQINLNYDP